MQFVQQNVFHYFYLSHFHEMHQIQLDLLLKFDCYCQENASVLFCYSIQALIYSLNAASRLKFQLKRIHKLV